MTTVYFNSTPCHTNGQLPTVGSVAPDYQFTTAELKEMTADDFKGRRVVLNIFPSLDTEVCARSVRRFNEEAGKLDNTSVVCISMDLPFAMGRFCTLEGLKNVVAGSVFRNPEFYKEFGCMLVDGPLKGLLARCVVVLDEDNRVMYREMVEEITNEPDYAAALEVLKRN